MRRILSILTLSLLVLGWAGISGAVEYTFEDKIDWNNGNGITITEPSIGFGELSTALAYTHDINGDADTNNITTFSTTYTVLDAYLILEFDDEDSDSDYWVGDFWTGHLVSQQLEEIVYYLDPQDSDILFGDFNRSYIPAFEIDDGVYGQATSLFDEDIVALQSDGRLDVDMRVFGGSSGWSEDGDWELFIPADVVIKSSMLRVIADDGRDPEDPTNPVPEPATMILLGTGLIGIAGLSRKRMY